jgi:hypothetical protein
MTPAAGFNTDTPINFISNGSRNSTSDILMDGISATSFEQNSGILDPLYIPSVDSVPAPGWIALATQCSSDRTADPPNSTKCDWNSPAMA